MSEHLGIVNSCNRFPEKSSQRDFKLWNKLILHLLRDLLPVLFMISVISGLALQAVEYLEQQRVSRQVVMLSK